MDWSTAQSETKFASLIDFGHILPRIQRRVKSDLDQDVGERDSALAAAVALTDRTPMRVGNPDYTRKNGSYGGLTPRRKHVTFEGNSIRLAYKAKGGKPVRWQLQDRTLARILHKIGDLPEAEMLMWVDDAGEPHALNSYISDASGGEEFTAKTFRTWTGSRVAFEVAEQGGATIKAITEAAAEQLNNTPSIARTSYVHPSIIDLADAEALEVEPVQRSGLLTSEARMLALLERS